ncbi:MAG TPA: hypothetical protein VHC22_16705 [Pirellulales bacterium]|nr:hypothetical protein [Pirellulales bacterium]
MFQVLGSRMAWRPWLLALVCAHMGVVQMTFAADDKSAPKRGAVLDTYAKPDGAAYFALKLSPEVVQPKNRPNDVVVLFDTSASQIGGYRTKALGALRAMLSGLAADDRVALLAADVTAARLTQSFVPANSGAMNQALAALERRVPLGSTDMPAALDEAVATWPDDDDAGRTKSVVYIGDGFSTARLVPVDRLERIVSQYTARRVACSSYAIGPRVNAELLGALANHTGGMVIPDDETATDRQVGQYLAAVARTSVIWPTATHWPAALKQVYPRRTPPLRFDRDSVLLGTIEPQALKAHETLSFEIEAEMAGRPVLLKWQAVPGEALAENAYLTSVVEWAAHNGGLTLPTAGSATLNDMRRWMTFGAQQLARLGERALAIGRTEEAAQLAGAAEDLDPTNAEADVVREAAGRSRQSASGDLRLTRQPTESAAPTATKTEVADGELLDDLDRQGRIVEDFLRTEVHNALNQANADMSVNPDGARDQLKLLLEKVQRTAEVSPDARSQMVDKIEAGLRSASRISTIKTEIDLRHQQVSAEVEARESINRQLYVQEQKVDQLMARFNALMAEERFRDAEAVAGIAAEMQPGSPALRGAELASRTVGHTADITAVRDQRHKGTVDMLFSVELSTMPTADDPPIIYPDPGVWQMMSERRKKYKAVDLTEHGPNETKILEALDDKTEIDFAEQPLSDVVDYLKQRHGIEIQLDKKALTDAGIGSEVPITRTIGGVTLRSALKLLLGELDLTYVLRNEVLMITSKTEAENMLSHRVYPVADLVVPIAPPRNMAGPGAGGMGGGLLGSPMGGTGMGMGMGGMGMGMGGMGMGGMGMGMGNMGMGGGMGFF